MASSPPLPTAQDDEGGVIPEQTGHAHDAAGGEVGATASRLRSDRRRRSASGLEK